MLSFKQYIFCTCTHLSFSAVQNLILYPCLHRFHLVEQKGHWPYYKKMPSEVGGIFWRTIKLARVWNGDVPGVRTSHITTVYNVSPNGACWSLHPLARHWFALAWTFWSSKISRPLCLANLLDCCTTFFPFLQIQNSTSGFHNKRKIIFLQQRKSSKIWYVTLQCHSYL